MQPKRSSNRRITSSGIAAPPEAHSSRRDASTSPSSATMAANMVGTPSKRVTRSRSMISSARPASNRGRSVRQPPTLIIKLSPHVCPKEWNTGRAPSAMLAAVAANSPRAASVLLPRFP